MTRSFNNTFIFLIGLILSTFCYAQKNQTTEKQTTEKKADKTSEIKLAPVPELKNKSYILMDFHTGQVLAERNADLPLPPASLTKMMTSYLLEQRLTNGKIKENDPIKISRYAACDLKKGESCMFLRAGKTATAIDVLRGIVIQSGNDASRAVAEHISGTEDDFATLMNQEAATLGLTNTNYKNSTGMPDLGHESTAKDLAILAQAIIKKNSRYYPIYAEKSFTYDKIKQYNRNQLLFKDKTVDGLKTGHTNEAGYCLVASSKHKDMRLISVVMGTDSKRARTNQSRELLKWGYDNFVTKVIYPKNHFIAKKKVWFGQENEVNLVVGNDFNILTQKALVNHIKTEIKLPDSLEAPVKAGQKVGEITAFADGKRIASAPIQVMENVERAGFFSRMIDHIRLFFKNLF